MKKKSQKNMDMTKWSLLRAASVKTLTHVVNTLQRMVETKRTATLPLVLENF